MTVIYGENGVGKTTLAAVVDSMRESSPEAMVRRRSLPGTIPPEASVTLDGVTYVFDGASWSAQPPYDTVDVFCPDFVNRNVYMGGSVGPDNKRNLCELVLGRQAVADVDRLAAATDAATSAVKEGKRLDGELRQLIKPVHTVAEFMKLTQDADIEDKHAAAVKALAEARSAEATAKRLVPSAVVLPVIDRTLIDRILSATTDKVGADVAAIVRDHVKDHLDQKGEEWLTYGAAHADNDACPFCGQDLRDVKLVEAIRTYFGDEYRSFIDGIQGDIAALRNALGSDTLSAFRTDMASQIAIAASWNEQSPVDVVALNAALDQADREWQAAATQMKALLQKKLGSPLDAVPLQEADSALAGYEEALASLKPVNDALTACSVAAAAHKAKVSGANVDELIKGIQRLDDQKARHEPDTLQLIADIQKAADTRKAAEDAKVAIKKAIDNHAARVIAPYQASINAYLGDFGCRMRIDAVEPRFPVGKASVSYKMVVRGTEIPLGAVAGEPCFDSVLSEGDKYSLALAFFFARLGSNTNLTGRVVLLDDPVNSLGGSRRLAIETVIRDLRKRGAQVVVLTHDDRLAAMIWRDSIKLPHMKDIVTLAVEEVANGSRMVPWDAEYATSSQYVKDYITLADFLNGDGSAAETAPAIRRYVEQRLRHLYPGPPLTTRDTLGCMIGRIREAASGSRLEALKGVLPELEKINDASLFAHHASDDPGLAVLKDGEVREWARRALDVLG